MNFIEMYAKLERLTQAGGPAPTLLGIGPMSPAVLRASFELAREKDFPLMFIASRNQIDSKEFGGGYVGGWDQTAFCDFIGGMAKETEFDGLYYICRDHGGPWQRDEEKKAALPEAEAMKRGIRSYLADLEAGFDLLHIDPTKDPHATGTVPMDTVLRRTVELIERIEAVRTAKKLPPIGYEVGTEETNGGLTGHEAFAEFIVRLHAILDQSKLPRPQFIVGQTGTLVRMTENVGHFSRDNAGELAKIALQHKVGLKEHNSDYLTDAQLLMHPALRVTASNVAPEFGVVETDSYLGLAAIEQAEAATGHVAQPSNFINAIEAEAVGSGRWRKWMVGEAAKTGAEEVLRDKALTQHIVRISGHYTFDIPAVKTELDKMMANLTSLGVPAQRYVVGNIKRAIDRYVVNYGLEGLTGKLRNM